MTCLEGFLYNSLKARNKIKDTLRRLKSMIFTKSNKTRDFDRSDNLISDVNIMLLLILAYRFILQGLLNYYIQILLPDTVY